MQLNVSCLKALRSFSHAGRSQHRQAWFTLALAGLMLFPVRGLAPVTALAQSDTGSCQTRVPFPPPGSTPTVINAGGLCLSNTDNDGDTIFLRFLGPSCSPPDGLALFDHTELGELWCAHASNGSCAQGTQLILRPDGNLELNDGDIQTWDTDTPNTNNGHEFLKITQFAQACIVVVDPSNNTENQIWCSNNSPL